MIKFLGFVLLVVMTLAWIVWHARRCSSYGCGAQELSKHS